MKQVRFSTQIRIDNNIADKARFISEKEKRSFNAQLEYFIIKGIETFEKENGTIPFPS